MASSPVALRAQAVDDVERIVDHYLDEAGESLALKFVDALERATIRIGRVPLIGTLRFSYEVGIPDLRAWPIGRFPYLIFYVAGADRVDVWRVLHSRRDLPAELTEATDVP